MVVSSLGVTSGGLAVAEVTETDLGDTETSATTSTPPSNVVVPQTHITSPSVQPNLSPAPVPKPEFSPSPPVAQTHSSHLSQPMQPPVPPPNAAAIVIPAPAASPTMAESLLKPATTPIATEPGGAEALMDSAVPVAPAPAPTMAAPEAAPAAPLAVPNQIAADESVPAGFNSVFIDPTNYGVGATQAPSAPSVVFSERSTGCEITVSGGQPVSSCGPAATPAGNGQLAGGGAGGGGGVQVGPVTVGPRGVSLGSTTVVSREVLNERLRPLNRMRRGNESYVFPLSIPAAISSTFGWRMHPVHQTWRFHSGTDLAAPTGTPVLATQAGRVAVSDFLGGYGLTVILRHGDGNLESRYAHLSQITVRSGDWVEQGEAIGLVGSTGVSTGPHLHFEIRQLSGEGWIAMDPQEILEYGIANLLEIMNNPMAALNRTQADGAADAATEMLPVDYPFRPAQPNAS